MKRSLWIAFVTLMALPPFITGQTAPAHAAPTPHLGRQPSLVESIKQGSSACGTDYGERIEEVRNAIVDNTLKSYEFWITIVSLGLNLALFFYVFHLDSVRRQVIRTTARLVAEYQSQLAAGQRKYQLLQQSYAEFVDDFEQEKEPRISTKAPVQKGRTADDNKTNATDPRPASGQTGASPASATAEETVSSMRQQITTLTRQLESERQKNRRLQGE